MIKDIQARVEARAAELERLKKQSKTPAVRSGVKAGGVNDGAKAVAMPAGSNFGHY